MKVLRSVLAFLAAVIVLLWGRAGGHEMRSGYLEIKEVGESEYDLRWRMPLDALDQLLELEFSDGVEIVGEPVSAIMSGARIQRLKLRRKGGLPGAEVQIRGLEQTLVDVLLRFEMRDGRIITHRLTPESPRYLFEADPGPWRLASTYLVIGIEHILLGVDHLMFVLGLLLLVDRRWMLVKTVTAFTVAHSITLGLSTFALIKVPEDALNAAIALSIFFLGPEVVRKWRGGDSLAIRHPWIVAFLFGLLHGIGFASGLSVTGLPASGIPIVLLFFNLGVEVGQLAFVLLALLVARSIQCLELDRQVWVPRFPGYLVGTLGAYWTIQRITIMISPIQ